MEEVKQIIFNETIDTNIFDEDIDVKVATKLKEANIEFNKELYYRIEVSFDLKAYEDIVKLRSFIVKNDKLIERIKDDKDLIGEMLSQQLE